MFTESIPTAEAARIRHDCDAGTSLVRPFGRHALLGEAVFVPCSDDAAEGDGWLLAHACSGASDSSAGADRRALAARPDRVSRQLGS